MVIVTTPPSSTPVVVPAMLTPALAWLALMMLPASMAMCPAKVLIAIVGSGGVGGGGGGGGGGVISWGTSMNPELAAIVLMVTWSGIASFWGRLKLIGWSCSGALKVGVLD